MDSFTPIDYVYYEILDEAKSKKLDGVIHFFQDGNQIESEKGTVKEILKEKEGDFLLLDSNAKIRLDKIITIFGKPGPAYDYYDSFANACMDCMGGMD
ncbi:MAG TPA: hypothetical protein VD908_14420 [Cytophagales bacterium]|nr:hypothetical protein [Cytophagales bacterium]